MNKKFESFKKYLTRGPLKVTLPIFGGDYFDVKVKNVGLMSFYNDLNKKKIDAHICIITLDDVTYQPTGQKILELNRGFRKNIEYYFGHLMRTYFGFHMSVNVIMTD